MHGLFEVCELINSEVVVYLRVQVIRGARAIQGNTVPSIRYILLIYLLFAIF